MTRTTNTKTAAQQAELDKLRAAKTKATVVDTPTKSAVEPEVLEPIADEAETAQLVGTLTEAYAKLQSKLGVDSFRRYVSALIISGAASFGVGYLGGLIIETMYAALMLSGWTFLAWAVWILGLLITIYLGVKAGQAAYNYIADKRIDAHVDVCKSFVVGAWNSLFNKPVAA